MDYNFSKNTFFCSRFFTKYQCFYHNLEVFVFSSLKGHWPIFILFSSFTNFQPLIKIVIKTQNDREQREKKKKK